ncbi:cyclic nucleotide-binding domain-containing protein [Pendulispora albinea]|uniref:Cyclic nucleotide-binding domain-containing protein n=1 Tax=Pendulispora albinea TaxID=2741071 RepID=A0ABZ2M012_9BACT
MSETDPAAALSSLAPVTAARLREIGLFGALSDEVITHLAASLKPLHLAPGDAIFREGDSAREMYVVLDGEVEVLKRSRRSRDVRVAILGPNDTFGEMSLIDVQARSATVRAVAHTRLLRMASEDLDWLYRHDLKSYALITLNIARDLSRRLRVADGILADFAASVLDEYVVGGRT